MTAWRVRSRRAGVVLLAAALAAAVGVGWERAARHDAGAAVEYDAGTRLLSFTLPQFTGGALTTDALRGRPAVVNFYASWCSVCRQEMPEFERFAQEASGRVTVIGVNPQSNDDDAAQAASWRRPA
jgi:thiol-disulfide isomerase/thioredoxin